MRKLITDNMFIIVLVLIAGVGYIYWKNYQAKKTANT